MDWQPYSVASGAVQVYAPTTPPGDYAPTQRVKLTNAAVSEVKQYTEGTGSGSTVLEDVSFTYQKIEVQDLGTGTLAADDWLAQAAN